MEYGAPVVTRAYRELRDEYAEIWDRFDALFRFRPSIQVFPAITEPTPSVTWRLGGADDDRFVETVQRAVTALAGEGSLLCLDWQHTSYRVWPRLVGPDNLDPPGAPGWPLSPYPDGDYHIYLAEDFRFGTFGHPWERTLCVFGADLLDRVEVDLHEIFGAPLRRDGAPAT